MVSGFTRLPTRRANAISPDLRCLAGSCLGPPDWGRLIAACFPATFCLVTLESEGQVSTDRYTCTVSHLSVSNPKTCRCYLWDVGLLRFAGLVSKIPLGRFDGLAQNLKGPSCFHKAFTDRQIGCGSKIPGTQKTIFVKKNMFPKPVVCRGFLFDP